MSNPPPDKPRRCALFCDDDKPGEFERGKGEPCKRCGRPAWQHRAVWK